MSSQTANAFLLKSSANGNVKGAILAFQHGADPNCQDRFGQRPILVAAQQRDHEMIGLLMKRGADPRCLGTNGMFPMGLGAIVDNLDIIDALGAHCWDAESPSEMVPSALEAALLANSYTAARHLIRHGADLRARGAFGETVLMRFSALGNEAVVRLLLSEGSLWFLTDNDGCTAIDYARRTGNLNVAKMIEEHARTEPLVNPGGKLPRALTERPDLSDRDIDNIAAAEVTRIGDEEPWAPLANPAKPSLKLRWRRAQDRAKWRSSQIQQQIYWLSPKRWAMLKRTQDVMSSLRAGNVHKAWLQYRKAPVLVNARDEHGTPLLQLAVRALNLPDSSSTLDKLRVERKERLALGAQLVQAIVQAGARIHACDGSTGATLAHTMLEGPYAPMYFAMIDDKVLEGTLNRSNFRLERPLHIATRRRDIVGIQGLLARGCDLNPVNKDGFAPLHHCALHVDHEVAAMLINAGANPLLRTRRGQTISKILESMGSRTESFRALLTARQDIEKIMSIFSPDNPMAAAVRAKRQQAGGKPSA